MNFPSRNSIPRTIVNAAAAVLAALIVCAAFVASAEAAPCPSGKSAVTVNANTVCSKLSALSTDRAAFSAANSVGNMIKRIATPRKLGNLKLTKKTKRALPKATKLARVLAAKIEAGNYKSKKSTSKKKSVSRKAGVAGVGPVVDRISIPGKSITTDDGVTITSSAEGVAFSDGSKEFTIHIDITDGKDTVRLIPQIDVEKRGWQEVGCPTADGLVELSDTETTGATAMVLRGKSVKASITERTTRTINARGHVGRDAKLHDVDATVSTKFEHYERGLQAVTEISGQMSIQREGEPTASGPINVTVHAKAAGATAAQERAAEQQSASELLAAPSLGQALGSSVESARWHMLHDEHKWYDIPNGCAQIRYDPDPIAKIKHGQTVPVTGYVIASNGEGEAHSSFAVGAVSRGSFSASNPNGDPGAPAQFTAKGAQQDVNPQTVEAAVTATSTAGRAERGYYAEDKPLDLPETFTGTVSATTISSGVSVTFAGTATYTKQSVFVSPQGFVSAWYELTSATLTSAKHEIGVGCRWVATGTGGSIADGDIELRREPGGDFKYALLYDTEIEPATFVPTDCPPGSALPTITGSIVAFLNTHAVNAEFRPVGPNFKLAASGATDVIGGAGQSTTASWDLTAGD